jgi:protein associated with RNAse G/E
MGLTIENFLHFDTIDLKKELGDGTDKIDIDEYFKNADQINYESTINDRMDVMVQVSRAY